MANAKRRLAWVGTTGGPHLVVPEKHAAHWEGEAEPSHGRLVGEVAAAWGRPLYAGRCDEAEYPWCVLGNRIAVWRRGGSFAYVAVRHEDKEFPVELVAGASDGTLE